jgi:hypothetical protein
MTFGQIRKDKNMNRLLFIALCLALGLTVLAGCSGSISVGAAPQPTYTASRFDTSYADALTSFTLPALGIIKLDGTPQAITPEQAKTLLPLWQALRSSINAGGAGQAEVNALLAQIDAALTPEQVTAINALKLTKTEMREWGQANGLVPQGFSPQMMATQQAAAKSGAAPGQVAVGLLDATVKYLEARR